MNRFRHAALLGGLLAAWVAAWAAPATHAPDPQFSSVPVPRDLVASLAQDREGFIWVGTADGVARFDGYRLRPIERHGDSAVQRSLGWVRALAAGRDGRVWIGTERDGLAVYDPDRDRVEAIGGLSGAAPRRNSQVRALAEDAQGRIWMATLGEGVLRYDPQTRSFRTQALEWRGQPEVRTLALQLGREGRTWVGHWQGLAYRDAQQRDGWKHLGLADRHTVQTLLEDRDGRLWFGTQDGRLGVVQDQQARWVAAESMGPVQALAQGPDGLLWVGHGKGIHWIDPATGQTRQHLHHQPSRPGGLAGNEVSSLLRDQAGALWVGGFGLGLQRHRHHPTLAVRGPDNDPNSPLAQVDVRSLAALQTGQLLASSQAGPVALLDGQPGQHLRTLGTWLPSSGRPVDAMAEAADGSVWLVRAGQLEHRTAQGSLLRQWPTTGGRAQRLLALPSGELWLGMQDGLLRLRHPQAAALERITQSDGKPLQGAVFALLQRAEGLWIGGHVGLWRWQGDRLEPLPIAPEAGLGFPVVLALMQGRDGSVWVDTAVAGLHRLKGLDDQGRARFDRISERLGFGGRSFGANLREDAAGRIWSPQHVYDPLADRLDEMGSAEGAQFGTPWFFADATLPDGRLVFGGSRGMLVVQPADFSPSRYSPPLVISSMRLDGQPFHPESRRRGIQLPPGTQSFGVEFAALDYADPQRLRYQYRLQGLESHWTLADSGARNPSFTRLPPGRYVLQLRATNRHGHWSPQTLELPVEVQPQWWQYPAWPWVGAGLGLLLLRAWVRWRTRQLRQREARLQALVEARTAELQSLSLTDALTGLNNRRYLTQRIAEDLEQALRQHARGLRQDADLLVFLIDVDHFKRINDRHGHGVGDQVLMQMAERLRQVFGEQDSLVRWGGEEFLALARRRHRDQAGELASQLLQTVRTQAFELDGEPALAVTVSCGFVAFPLDPQQPQAWRWNDVLRLADAALYAAKAQGRDGYVGVLRAHGIQPDELPTTAGSAWLRETRLEVKASR